MIITLDYDDVTLYAHNIYVMFYLHNNAHVGWRLAAALLPLLFRKNPRSHHKGATGRIQTGDQLLPVLCHCQLGQDIPVIQHM